MPLVLEPLHALTLLCWQIHSHYNMQCTKQATRHICSQMGDEQYVLGAHGLCLSKQVTSGSKFLVFLAASVPCHLSICQCSSWKCVRNIAYYRYLRNICWQSCWKYISIGFKVPALVVFWAAAPSCRGKKKMDVWETSCTPPNVISHKYTMEVKKYRGGKREIQICFQLKYILTNR